VSGYRYTEGVCDQNMSAVDPSIPGNLHVPTARTDAVRVFLKLVDLERAKAVANNVSSIELLTDKEPYLRLLSRFDQDDATLVRSGVLGLLEQGIVEIDGQGDTTSQDRALLAQVFLGGALALHGQSIALSARAKAAVVNRLEVTSTTRSLESEFRSDSPVAATWVSPSTVDEFVSEVYKPRRPKKTGKKPETKSGGTDSSVFAVVFVIVAAIVAWILFRGSSPPTPNKAQADFGDLRAGVKVVDCTRKRNLLIRDRPAMDAVVLSSWPNGVALSLMAGPSTNGEGVWWQVQMGNAGWVRQGPDEDDPRFICTMR
jgi:hypothetical protein